MTRENIISALKRNQKVEITAIIATALGADVDALAEVTDTTRATDKFYQSVFDLVKFDETEDEEEVEVTDEPEAEEEVDTVDHSFDDIRKAIKKGKGKKALKLIKKAKENGARGSVLKGLKQEAEAL